MPHPRQILLALGTATLMAMPSQAAEPYEWGSVVMGGGGYVSGIFASPLEKDLFYSRTDVGGAYRWRESTKSWIPLQDWMGGNSMGLMGVEALAIDPIKASRVYLLCGTSYFNSGKTAILRSDDYGTTWRTTEVTPLFKAHGNGGGRGNGEKLVVDPNQNGILFSGSRSAGLFRSSDTAATWTKVGGFPVTTTPSGEGIVFVLMDKASSTRGNPTKVLYAGVSREGENLYVSKDAGTTWQAVAGGPALGIPQRGALASDGALYITYGHDANSALWKFDTRTGAWTNVSPKSVGRTYSAINVDPTDPKRLLTSQISWTWTQWGYGDRIHLTTDGGTTWRETVGGGVGKTAWDPNGSSWIQGHTIHWSSTVVVDPFNPERVFVNSGNGIFLCENIDSAVTVWKFASDGLEETVVLDLASLPGLQLISGLGDIDGFTHPDVKKTPQFHLPRLNTNTTGVAGATRRNGFLARVGTKLAWSMDNGKTWTQTPTLPVPTAYRGTIAMSADGGVLLWTQAGAHYRTTDMGKTWTIVQGLSVGDRIKADAVNPRKFYAYDRATGDVFTSRDGGATFAKTTTLAKYGSSNLATVPGREGEVWIAMGGSGLMVSKDSGTSFTKVPGVIANGVSLGKAAPGKSVPAAYVWGRVGTGPDGMYRSIDGGATWDRINDDLHQFGGFYGLIVADPTIYGRVYMNTVGRGVIWGEPKGSTVGTSRERERSAPSQARLLGGLGDRALEIASPGNHRVTFVGADGSQRELFTCVGPCRRDLSLSGAGIGWVLIASPEGNQAIPVAHPGDR